MTRISQFHASGILIGMRSKIIGEEMSDRKHSPSPSGMDIARIIRPVFEAFLGRTGLRVLEYHLEKLLQNDPYDALLADPHRFYLAMRSLFGQGSDMITQIMAKKMIEENILDAGDPNKLLEALKDPREGREKLLKMLRLHESNVL